MTDLVEEVAERITRPHREKQDEKLGDVSRDVIKVVLNAMHESLEVDLGEYGIGYKLSDHDIITFLLKFAQYHNINSEDNNQ